MCPPITYSFHINWIIMFGGKRFKVRVGSFPYQYWGLNYVFKLSVAPFPDF